MDLQQQLFLAVLTAGGIFLSLALQPGVSGLVALILPVVGLGLAIKLSAHDLRTGQINYYLRFVLKSPWEIIRRLLFSGSKISDEESQILLEQAIDVQAPEKKHQLSPLFPNMHAVGNGVVFLTIHIVALGVGMIRTYHDAAHGDPLTLFLWVTALLATVATMYTLQRRRVR
jgi:hypothetical protein